jgi:uncharacterized protein with HEPN domain
MKHNLPFLKHILDEANFLIDKTKGLTFEDYLKDEVLKRATTRSIEIIGEASKNLSDDFKNKHSDIKWKDIAGMRDKIIHFYFGIKWNVVWSVIQNEVQPLKLKIEEVIKGVGEL